MREHDARLWRPAGGTRRANPKPDRPFGALPHVLSRPIAVRCHWRIPTSTVAAGWRGFHQSRPRHISGCPDGGDRAGAKSNGHADAIDDRRGGKGKGKYS